MPKQEQQVREEKREWTKPEVRKMRAGSAEDGGGTLPDLNAMS